MLANVHDSAGIFGSVITILVNVTLPVFLAPKVKVTVDPTVVNCAGPALVISSPGSSTTGTSALAEGALMVAPLYGNDAMAVLRTTPAFSCAWVGE